ncbi:2-oxo-4-hydroxy-4-carboxy-5-ureidoimidazoline decarboxylase [Oculatella sp. LEGE 06141]|uniref:2-oxo-4-hydroxy-4-carboxy-5-ureidoimidazoline decarboxylase n=1 Tax=Oculatella sp. LEGE 06141 TaxID=1828648 RepID=UPI0018821DB9|nr:2-oxo-4-hydroxy-4-carboxy-5-ureidoimidazoline decarboxylase [Oculatella sp. LEGE 06141]MBE9181422.1 2-oxo-4-hydroxy-4-carboxy-5-ureidoimidazoline decarboxylase [Oculatella sp. LEGE 06141]
MPYSITELNQMDRETFVKAFGAVFEDTPAIAAQAWLARPFRDIDDLHQKMIEVVNQMTPDDQLALIRAHPDLGSQAKMAEASVKEQEGIGLNRLDAQEYERFQRLNQTYKDKFQFPFIVAVKHHTKASVLEAFEQRLNNTILTEIKQALLEINQIARFRLSNLVERS